MLSNEEQKFLDKRASLSRRWPIVGAAMLLLMVAFTAWLWFSSPRLINPWLVFREIETGVLSDSMTVLMAAMLPVAMLSLLGFVALTILVMFVAFANERKLVAIVRQLLKSGADR